MGKLSLAVLSLSLSGCATIWSGNTKDVNVQVPPGSVVEIERAKNTSTVYRGSGGIVRLDTSYSYLIAVTTPGDPTRAAMLLPLDRRLDGATFLNILWVIPIFWGVGVAVDMATGSFWTLPGEIAFGPAPRATASPATVPQPSAPQVARPERSGGAEDAPGTAVAPPSTAGRAVTYDQLQQALAQIQAGHRDVAMRILGPPQFADAETAYWWASLPATGDCFVLKLSATRGNSLETAAADKCARTPSPPGTPY